MEENKKADRECRTAEFKEDFEFEEKRRVLVQISYINEDGSLEEIWKTEADGALACGFEGWDKEHGCHNGAKKAIVKTSAMDVAGMVVSDDELKGAAGIIVEMCAREIVGEMLSKLMEK